MARNSVLLRHLLRFSPSSRARSSSLIETLASSPIAVPSPPIHTISSFFTTATANSQFSRPCLNYRTLCSSSGQSKIALIKSEEEFNTSLSKHFSLVTYLFKFIVIDESLPAIFYFTAVWCGPCRFIAPIIAELSEKYPHVTTYKIDIDQDGLENTLRRLNIASVPTLHFFQNGKKAAEIIGADVARLKDTMDKLYK
ncbi:Thioredoxin O1, mitochondrial [Vitis vinifera]|uniref:Thioredoxin O1, mitochondrial n=1 Tax=Vitis vinifera TaxID=29760 RepID=A0A438J1E1_VITVI|nr:Thioredoxin O1, mitochondrial [Vitis vinifera]RVX02779.1 Thioredoxin O1, mitochondrial [Vitis vinifera]